MADITFALRDAFEDNSQNVNLQSEIVNHFINGYRMARSIDIAELAYMPLFLQMHHLITFVKLHHTLEPDEHPEEPAWAARLRRKLQAKMAFYRDEFALSLQ